MPGRDRSRWGRLLFETAGREETKEKTASGRLTTLTGNSWRPARQD
jgi:hypothetical protein